MGEGTLNDRREGPGRVEEGGVVHKGHDQLGRGTTTRGGIRQSMCHPALQVSHRSFFFFVEGALADLTMCVFKEATEGARGGCG